MNEENNIVPLKKELNVVKYDVENIRNLIYTIRGKQVMLDSDVAILYHYETKYINLAVRRNKERFPENFCFQLTKEEFDNLRLQFATLNYQLDINKFNKQYPSLKISYTNKFHDRFIVIDSKELYHCGASLKDLGKKCFAINKMKDAEYIEKICEFS